MSVMSKRTDFFASLLTIVLGFAAVGISPVAVAAETAPAPPAKRVKAEKPDKKKKKAKPNDSPAQTGSAAATKAAGEAIPPPPDVGAPPADSVKTESGVAYRVLAPGKGGGSPSLTDLVTVHYTGWIAADGKMIDSSVARGVPLTAAVENLLKGWRVALPQMSRGEKRRLWIPQELAFEGNPAAPRGGIVYDVELIDFKAGPSVPPPDVAVPPADATRTATGLVWKILRPGTGEVRPTLTSNVTIHFSGWDTSGKSVASSVARGKPVTFKVDTQNQGWQQAIPLMVAGEVRRIWVPARLAYLGQDGRPQGDLTYDIELISVDK